MKFVLPAVALLAVLPARADAQVRVRLPSLEDPRIRASLGGIGVSAGLGDRGIDIRLDDAGTRTRTTTTGRRAPVPERRAPAPTSPRPTTRTSASAAAVLNTADDYVGVPYVWGGTTPRGFDCSGFVQYVFREHGVNLPRTSRQQAGAGIPIAVSVGALQPGDLMLFATNGSRIDHIAIYVGGNRIIHSSSSGGGVGYDDLSTQRGRWFVAHHVESRRVLANGRSLVRNLDMLLRSFTELDPPDVAPRR